MCIYVCMYLIMNKVKVKVDGQRAKWSTIYLRIRNVLCVYQFMLTFKAGKINQTRGQTLMYM